MKMLLAAILGWTLCIGFQEYKEWEYAELVNDALDDGHVWTYDKKDGTRIKPIDEYVEARRTKILDIITYKPNLWTCRYLFEHEHCPIKSLLRSPIPLKNRPKPRYD